MKRLSASLALVSLFFLLAGSVSAATMVHLKMKGKTKTVASCTLGSDNKCSFDNVAPGEYDIEVKADGKTFNTSKAPSSATSPACFEVKAPRDVATGQSSGKRQHGYIKIVKQWDASTPKLAELVVTIEDDKISVEWTRAGHATH